MDISLPTRNNGPILLSDVKKWKGLFKHEFLNKQGIVTFSNSNLILISDSNMILNSNSNFKLFIKTI